MSSTTATFPVPLAAGKAALLLGAVALVAIYVPLWRRQRDGAVLVQAFGGVLAIGGLLLWPAVGYPLLALALLAFTGWLGLHDVAWRSQRSTGLPRFLAGCLLAGWVGDSLGVELAWQAGGVGAIAALPLFVAIAAGSAATAGRVRR